MIYLSGSCASEDRTIMTKIAKYLRDAGNEVYCPFELKIENAWDYSQEQWASMVYDADIKALENSDVFLFISPGRISTAGSNWEQGYVCALNKDPGKKPKKIIVIQYTDSPTSLITFEGCHIFKNSNPKDLYKDILEAIVCIPGPKICKTVLT